MGKVQAFYLLHDAKGSRDCANKEIVGQVDLTWLRFPSSQGIFPSSMFADRLMPDIETKKLRQCVEVPFRGKAEAA
jgi:hypothetical protein